MSEKAMDPAAPKPSPAAPKPSIEELRAGILRTRAELGETVQALAAKADVKARAVERVEVARQRLRAQPVPLALVFAGVIAVVGVVLVVRGRRR